MIQFRTPSVEPIENSGVQHIIEHSVLCGSKNFNLKEPFTSLMQSQIQSYLNAGTYTEHTEYPISSRNIKSYITLMETYLDAVFNPNILYDQLIFNQEGHHKTVDEQGNVVESGVVLNEMRGALGDIISKGLDYTKREFFKGYPMGTNSGGLPKDIIKLTYEQFKQYYETYYNPSNAIVFLYSLLPIEEEVKIIEKYLPERKGQQMDIKLKKDQFQTTLKTIKEYSDQEQDVFFACYYITDQQQITKEEYVLYQLIDQLIHDSSNTYFKKEFQGDFNSQVDFTEAQIYYQLTLSGSNVQSVEEFYEKVMQIYQKLSSDEDQYINEAALKAILQQLQCNYREDKDHIGINLGTYILRGYLYNSEDKLKFVELLDTMQSLMNDKNIVQKCKQLLKKMYQNGAYLHLIQGPQYEKQEEDKQNYTQQEKQLIQEYDQKIKARQMVEDSPEELKKLQNLKIEDLEHMHEDILQLKVQEKIYQKQRIITFPSTEIGISNVQLIIDLTDNLSKEDLQLLSFYCDLLQEVRTTHLELSQLEQEIQQTFIKFSVNIFTQDQEEKKYSKIYLCIKERFLDENMNNAKKLTDEIIYNSIDPLTPQEVDKQLNRLISNLRDSLQGDQAYDIAGTRSQASISPSANADEIASGVTYLKWMQQKQIKIDDMKKILKKISNSPVLLAISTQNNEIEEKLIQLFQVQANPIFDRFQDQQGLIGTQKYESVAIQSDVNYVGQAYYRKNLCLDSTNLLMTTVLYNTYLWDKVRVHGGAYGCFVTQNQENVLSLLSYRDPNVKSTVQTFKSIAQWLKNVDFNEEQLLKYKIGAFSDRQKSQVLKKRFQMAINYYLLNVDIDKYAKAVHDMLFVSNSDIQKLSEVYEEMAKQEIVVCGNEEKMKEFGIQKFEYL